MAQFKSIPQYIKKIDNDGRTVTGVFSVAGNLDAYDDRMFPGAFTKTFQEGGKKARHLWNHDFFSPPTASIKGLKELSRDELPPEVLAQVPEAMGGTEVTRTYLDTPRGNEILEGIKSGAIDEMSFGYDALQFDFDTVDEKRVRNIREVRLYDTSDVLWGANGATVGAKHGLPFTLSIDMLVKQLEQAMLEIKAGARNSTSDLAAINTIHRLSADLGTTECKGIIDEAVEEAAKAAKIPLNDLRARLFLLEA